MLCLGLSVFASVGADDSVRPGKGRSEEIAGRQSRRPLQRVGVRKNRRGGRDTGGRAHGPCPTGGGVRESGRGGAKPLPL